MTTPASTTPRSPSTTSSAASSASGRAIGSSTSAVDGAAWCCTPPAGKLRLQSKSFIERYVFPDGELHEVGSVVSAMQTQRIEVRDVESLREHYARTLRHWVANLEDSWDAAVSIVGSNRARVWRLYMAGSALGFEAGRTSIHQVLGVRASAVGASGMPLTRASFVLPESTHGAAAVDTHDLAVDVARVVR